MTNVSIAETSDEHQEVILKVLSELAPIDYDMLGHLTVKKILAGNNFIEAKGGHHMDFSESIGLLSAIATLAHFMLLSGIWGTNKIKEHLKKKKSETEISKSEILLAVEKEAQNHPALKNVIYNNPKILEGIYDVVYKVNNLKETQTYPDK